MKPSEVAVKVLAHSKFADTELITFEAYFPRVILSELNTHRSFSRNSASSRAIPVHKMISKAIDNPYIPRRFSINKSGMNASEFIDYGTPEWNELAGWWLESRDLAVSQVKKGLDKKLHKQVLNRIIEPYLMHTAIISATDLKNFFNLRLALDSDGNPQVDIPIFDLASEMMSALVLSNPDQMTKFDQWHLPLIGFTGDEYLNQTEKIMVSAARCARVSYLTHDGIRDVDADLKLFYQLRNNGHYSPFEHPAHSFQTDYRLGNYRNFRQLRFYTERDLTF